MLKIFIFALQDGVVHCKCPQGLLGNGWQCFAANNPCEIDHGGCSLNATCDYLFHEG